MKKLTATKAVSFRLSYFFFDDRDDLDDFAVFFFGTFAPDLRASERPIAIACLRLVTFLPDFPLFNVPFFFLCIAFSTFSDAFLPYLVAIRCSFPDPPIDQSSS